MEWHVVFSYSVATERKSLQGKVGFFPSIGRGVMPLTGKTIGKEREIATCMR